MSMDFQNLMDFHLSNIRPEIFSPEQCFVPNLLQFGQYNNTLFSNGLPIFNNYTKWNYMVAYYWPLYAKNDNKMVG